MPTNKEIVLSVLDFGDSSNADESIRELLNYAITAEALGFKRFWMGEHYIKNTIFCNPEPLIPAIAMITKKISVGTAGLLMRQHSIQRVATSFSLLEKMFPGRIDLGIVAPSVRPEAMSSGNNESPKEIFQKILECYQSMNSQCIHARSSPALWHLTSSIKSFASCEHNQAINLSKSLFHNYSNFDPELDEMHRIIEGYQKNGAYEPKITIAIGCFVTQSKKKLTEYKRFYKPLLSKEAYDLSVIDAPASLPDRIQAISHKYQTNDIIILNLGRSYQDKTESLGIISDTLNLKNAPQS